METPGRDAAPDQVADAMRASDRRGFLPASERRFADSDHPLPIGLGQTSSQPSTVAAMLRLLDVPVGARVLDVGSGSGWTTAILARLVGPGGSVLGLERHEDLVRFGAGNLAAQDLPWARIEQAEPGRLGRAVDGGYDRILVSASAARLPDALVEQLGAGGRMVVPVRHTMVLVERTAAGDVRVSEHGAYSFVPLIE